MSKYDTSTYVQPIQDAFNRTDDSFKVTRWLT